MRNTSVIGQIISCIVFLTLTGQAKDQYVVAGYTLKPGKYTDSICDTLAGEKNLYADFRAKNPDGTVNAVIDIPAGTNDKWETDPSSGHLYWELKNGAPRAVKFLGYPANYGMIPRTKGGDGDPLDVIVLGGMKRRGAVVAVKPIGVFYLEDNGKIDDKIIAVLTESFMGPLNNIAELDGLYPGMLPILKTWFSNYKGINGGLVAKDFGGQDTALAIIDAAIQNKDTTTVPLTPIERSDDSVVADGFTRTTGSYGQTLGGVLGSADSVSNGKNVYSDNPSRNADRTVNAVIEIPSGTNSKWETDVATGKLFWENQLGIRRMVRFLGYPGDYGMIPRTKGGDGDPLDVVVLGAPALRGDMIAAKIIGVMFLIDGGLLDDKILAVVPGKPMGEVNTLAELKASYPGVVPILQTWFTNYKGIGGGLESRGFGEWDTASIIVDKARASFGDPVKRPAELMKADRFFRAVPMIRRDAVNVGFFLTRAEHVRLDLFSLSGERIASIIDGDFTEGGHSFSWNVGTMRAGCYILKMRAGGHHETTTINLFK
jgi:inorganic pyrophosphatase